MKPSHISICRSLRKVMLRTCIGADGTTAKDYPNYPNYAENKIRFENGNGDLVNNRHNGRGGGLGAVAAPWAHHPPHHLKEALSELLPEEIPGLPRHRPGEFSPR